MSSKSVRRIDFMGAILLLGACLLVSTGLQQAALGYAWTSAYVLPLVLMTVPFLFAFLAWEWHVTTRRVHPEPVFPWRLIRSRICMGMVLYVSISQQIEAEDDPNANLTQKYFLFWRVPDDMPGTDPPTVHDCQRPFIP